MDGHLGGQRSEVLQLVEGGRQQSVIAEVGRRGDRGQPHAAVGELRAFQRAIAWVDRAMSGAERIDSKLDSESVTR